MPSLLPVFFSLPLNYLPFSKGKFLYVSTGGPVNCRLSQLQICVPLILSVTSGKPEVPCFLNIATFAKWQVLGFTCNLAIFILFNNVYPVRLPPHTIHYVLRIHKTSLWDPRCQTHVFKSQIT